MPQLFIATLAAALVLPSAAFAAKGDRSKDKNPAPSFGSVDKDANDTISETEYVAAAKARFAQLDKDADGKLSKEEFSADTTRPAKTKERKKKDA